MLRRNPDWEGTGQILRQMLAQLDTTPAKLTPWTFPNGLSST